jgi:hypothetical protein
VEIVRLPGKERDIGWWMTTVGPVVIAALALAVAFASVAFQHTSNQVAQAAATRVDASMVSLVPVGPSSLKIENLALRPIHSVWLAPAPHSLKSLGILDLCTITIVAVPARSKPALYFIDEAGVSWEVMTTGHLHQAPNPSPVVALLPLAIQPGLSVAAQTTKAPNCG